MASKRTHPLAQRPTYTNEQLDRFLSALPSKPGLSLQRFKDEMQQDPLHALTKLQRLSMAFIPWTSVSLHYSTHYTLSLDPTLLYHKIVERQLGGYCMENNTFFVTVLRSLGFECYVSGARISITEGGATGYEADGFGGWEHEVIFAVIGSQKYLIDIGFGAHGAIEPILLEVGETAKGVPGVTQRLVQKKLAPFTAGQVMWVVEVHTSKELEPAANAEDSKWRPAYCFSEQEWLPQDFELINYRTSHDPRSMFTYRILVTKTILDHSGDSATGQITMVGDEVTRRMGDKSEKETLRKCKSERERVDALDRWFDMKLTHEEAVGIRGRVSEIKV